MILALILMVAGAAAWAATVWLMAWQLLRPGRMTDGKAAYVLQRLSPGDLALAFEEIHFDVRDQRTGGNLRLAAWWIGAHADAARRDACVIFIHGYADAKVGAIAWAPLFHSLGVNICAIDLRAHGQSQGDHTTAGFFERHDLNQIINRLQMDRPGATRQVMLFGVSLGAAVAAATAAMRNDLSGVILDSPFADFASAASARAGRVGLPGAAFGHPAMQLARWFSGADFGAVRPVDLIPVISCPLLVIQSQADSMLAVGDDRRIADAVARRPKECGPSVCRTVAGADHALALAHDPQTYVQTVKQFIDQALGS